jgi:hypothetical protein
MIADGYEKDRMCIALNRPGWMKKGGYREGLELDWKDGSELTDGRPLSVTAFL